MRISDWSSDVCSSDLSSRRDTARYRRASRSVSECAVSADGNNLDSRLNRDNGPAGSFAVAHHEKFGLGCLLRRRSSSSAAFVDFDDDIATLACVSLFACCETFGLVGITRIAPSDLNAADGELLKQRSTGSTALAATRHDLKLTL